MKIITTLCILAISGAVALQAGDKKKPEGAAKATPEAAFKKLDKDGDGFVSKEEYLASPAAMKDAAKAEAHFKKLDTNSDGKLSLEEFSAAHTKAK